MFRAFTRRLSLAALCAVLAAAVCAAAPPPAGGIFPPANGPVNGPDGRLLMEKFGGKLLVLDVRTPEEFSRGHVPGAMLIPVQELRERLGEIPADRPVLIVCRTGRRAEAAYGMLAASRPRLLETGLWYLAATPEYKPDGAFVFP